MMTNQTSYPPPPPPPPCGSELFQLLLLSLQIPDGLSSAPSEPVQLNSKQTWRASVLACDRSGKSWENLHAAINADLGRTFGTVS